jgi:hypothetical protein
MEKHIILDSAGEGCMVGGVDFDKFFISKLYHFAIVVFMFMEIIFLIQTVIQHSRLEYMHISTQARK